jgi:hypothetical protein
MSVPLHNDPSARGRLTMPRSGVGRRLLCVKDAAIYLGRTEWALRELIWKGRVPVVRIDRRIQLDVKDLDALIESSKVRER